MGAWKTTTEVMREDGKSYVSVESLRKLYIEANTKGYQKQAQLLGRVLESVGDLERAKGWR